ncbi:MAG: hypothetical protein EOP49_06075, partial [Sphingobacteriales bacterium]
MKYRLYFIFLFLLVAGTIRGQQTVDISVSDLENGHPIEYAYVNLYSSYPKVLISTLMTDSSGKSRISITALPAEIEVVAMGYNAERQPVKDSLISAISFNLVKRAGSLNDVVVTGLSAPVRLKNALSTYQVITKATMQAQGAVTVDDALRNQLNINIGNDNILGSKVSMQGMKGDKVKILVDGMPLNGREMGEIDLSQINLNNVERIEIVQGPMSVLYGTDALGGVINIITKKNTEPWQVFAGTYYESIGKYNFDFGGTYRLRDAHQISISGGRNYFQGWQPLDSLERSFLWKPKEQYLANLGYSYSRTDRFRMQLGMDFVREK